MEVLLEAYTLTQPYSCTPTVRLDARYYLLLASTLHYICDVMLGGGLFVSG